MARAKLEAHISEPVERLIGEGANQTLATIREIEIIEGGKKLRTVQAADNDDDIAAQLLKAGFVAGSNVGNVIALERKPMDGFTKGILGCFGLMALIMVLVIGGCTVALMGSSDKSADDSDAIYACQQFVKDKLKSPSSAKFSNQVASGSGSNWTSKGTVDSQNSFGAMIQSRHSCTLTYLSSDESWTGSAKLIE